MFMRSYNKKIYIYFKYNLIVDLVKKTFAAKNIMDKI